MNNNINEGEGRYAREAEPEGPLSSILVSETESVFDLL